MYRIRQHHPLAARRDRAIEVAERVAGVGVERQGAIVTQATLVFAAQFFYVLLLGFQTQNVVGKHYAAAMGNSLLLGILGLTLTTVIARQAVLGSDWKVIGAFLLSGPCGIATSMWLHPKLRGSK
jgi:uncharacterized membrane protein (DUF485 family)